MKREKLSQRTLPDYTKGEEIFNMVSHIVGGAFGVIALVIGVIKAALYSDTWAVVGCSVYGGSLIILYTMSSVYHGLRVGLAKKVMRILDHCSIFILIAGTYTPILLSSIRKVSPGWAWTLFGIVWGFAALGIIFNSIDLKKFSAFSMICYIGMGWCIVLAIKPAIKAIDNTGLVFLVLGGVAYTVGAALYGIGKKHRYIHSVFHLFVLLGSVLQYICIIFWVI